MKRINRLALIFAAWMGILSFCVINKNPYANGIILYIGFLLVILYAGYVMENPNRKEQAWVNKLVKIF